MMRVTYLGPMMMANKHPVAAELKEQAFPASCFAVEVCSGEGIERPVMEGDVLVVNEDQLARPWMAGG